VTDALLSIIAGKDRTGLIEVRCRNPTNGRISAREWFPVQDRRGARRFIDTQSERLDVYVGVAPRARRSGGKTAIERAWCLWADIDTSEGIERLRAFTPQPSLVIHSGTSSNVHAYWSLSQPLSPAWAERANRRLAYHLGADMKATDAARILRPPGSLNHKHDPPERVTCDLVVPGIGHSQVWESVALPVALIVGHLPDPCTYKPARKRRADITDGDDPLRGVSADRYYEVLTGREVTRGNVCCPFHSGGQERNPSMRLYDDGTWYCFVCCEGGGIYQFAAQLWNTRARGRGFMELRERLTRELI